MQNPFDEFLFEDDLSPDRREALRAACADDPALAELLVAWDKLGAAVRDRLEAQIPDRRLLVLYALEASGRGDVLTPDEQAELKRARPELMAAFHAVPSLSDVTRRMSEECAAFEQAWDAHFTSPDPLPRAPDRDPVTRAHHGRRVVRWTWRVLALSALVVFAVVLVLVQQRDRSMVTVHVSEGEIRQIELADGSTVRLIGDAELTYADPDQATSFNRHVALEGQAFFEIVPAQDGFTVETPTGVAVVLGTSFAIRADEEAMEVVLASGRLSVASKAARDRMVLLEPGQMSLVARNALPSTPRVVDLQESLSWTGLIVFRSTPVEEAVARLSARYDIPVRVAPSLLAERVTGTFAVEQGLAEILDVMATALAAEVQGDAVQGYVLVPRGS